MSTQESRLVVGLTGSFGSGCTTLGKALHEMGFELFSFSNIVKKEWENKNPEKSAEKHAKRSELQDIGNELREKHGDYHLVLETIKEAKKEIEQQCPLVFDSIRHTAEIKALRQQFGGFVLIAVDCPIKDRWERVRTKYHSLRLDREEFYIDDSRDKNEAEIPFGQQVELCLDEADILIDNEKEFHEAEVVQKFKGKIKSYLKLIDGTSLRRPTLLESFMSTAYTASLMSGCIKRQVGAVIVDEKNNAVLSTGYNENPYPFKSCIEEHTKCPKDLYKEKYFKRLKDANVQCPSCSKLIGDISSTYKCECGFDLDKFFIPDRAVSQCTALHAEQRALMSVGGREMEGATLYTTTFPCLKCANMIIQSKIARVVYVSPYPDQNAAKALYQAGILTQRFEGVKARAYSRLFGVWRKEKEEQILRES